MTVDTEGRVRVFSRARWPVMVVAWLIAVVLITLLTSRVIHVVGRQLSANVSLPRPHAARVPSGVPTGQTVIVAPKTHQPRRPSSPPSAVPVVAQGIGGGGQSSQQSSGQTTVPPPSTKPTSARHHPSPSPKTSRPPSPPPVVTDQRVVQTAGGQAAFTCTSNSHLALLYATPAPGYTAEPPQVREASRMDVIFAGPHEQKIDARCEDGHLQAEVES